MREILFRGKCKDTGKWYEGYYANLHKTTYCFKEDYDRNPDNDMHQIIFEKMMDWGLPNQHFRVDVLPETVGQYTGLTDKNGKKIFEGDIVRAQDYLITSPFCDGVIGKIVYDECAFFIEPANPFDSLLMYNECAEYEVIGNLHDNPEILEGGE